MVSSPGALRRADIDSILDMLQRVERALRGIIRAANHPRFECLESHMFVRRAIESLLKTVPPKGRS
jgi:hypothetical protein